jgi:hypothetical protein
MSYAAANHAAIVLGLRVAVMGNVPVAAPVVPGQVAVAPATPSGTVTEQSPESGFKASKGDVLRLTLQAAGPAAAPVAVPVPAPAAH